MLDNAACLLDQLGAAGTALPRNALRLERRGHHRRTMLGLFDPSATDPVGYARAATATVADLGSGRRATPGPIRDRLPRSPVDHAAPAELARTPWVGLAEAERIYGIAGLAGVPATVSASWAGLCMYRASVLMQNPPRPR